MKLLLYQVDVFAGAVFRRTALSARQISRRGGELHCTLAGDRVRLGGQAVLYLSGTIAI